MFQSDLTNGNPNGLFSNNRMPNIMETKKINNALQRFPKL
jgi:hypothetical protein